MAEATIQALGVALGFVLTLMIYSYLLGGWEITRSTGWRCTLWWALDWGTPLSSSSMG